MSDYHVQFFTATILQWKPLLKKDSYKEIIVDSLQFMSNNGRVDIYAFVIMPNHLRILWKIDENHERAHVQRDFLKFTAQQIKFDLRNNHPEVLEQFKVNQKDRQYQFWEYRPLSIDIWDEKILIQKLNYIHHNPVQSKWNLCKYPEEYKYSSESFYINQDSMFLFLKYYKDY